MHLDLNDLSNVWSIFVGNITKLLESLQCQFDISMLVVLGLKTSVENKLYPRKRRKLKSEVSKLKERVFISAKKLPISSLWRHPSPEPITNHFRNFER